MEKPMTRYVLKTLGFVRIACVAAVGVQAAAPDDRVEFRWALQSGHGLVDRYVSSWANGTGAAYRSLDRQRDGRLGWIKFRWDNVKQRRTLQSGG